MLAESQLKEIQPWNDAAPLLPLTKAEGDNSFPTSFRLTIFKTFLLHNAKLTEYAYNRRRVYNKNWFLCASTTVTSRPNLCNKKGMTRLQPCSAILSSWGLLTEQNIYICHLSKIFGSSWTVGDSNPVLRSCHLEDFQISKIYIYAT